jgi:hypothetical protein
MFIDVATLQKSRRCGDLQAGNYAVHSKFNSQACAGNESYQQQRQ